MLGKRLKKYRLANKMSIAQLSKLSGVNQSYLTKIERSAASNLGIKIIKRLCETLRISTDLLIDGQITATNKLPFADKFARLSKNRQRKIEQTVDIFLQHDLLNFLEN